jgi:hypothetical protein
MQQNLKEKQKLLVVVYEREALYSYSIFSPSSPFPPNVNRDATCQSFFS